MIQRLQSNLYKATVLVLILVLPFKPPTNNTIQYNDNKQFQLYGSISVSYNSEVRAGEYIIKEVEGKLIYNFNI